MVIFEFLLDKFQL